MEVYSLPEEESRIGCELRRVFMSKLSRGDDMLTLGYPSVDGTLELVCCGSQMPTFELIIPRAVATAVRVSKERD